MAQSRTRVIRLPWASVAKTTWSMGCWVKVGGSPITVGSHAEIYRHGRTISIISGALHGLVLTCMKSNCSINNQQDNDDHEYMGMYCRRRVLQTHHSYIYAQLVYGIGRPESNYYNSLDRSPTQVK